MTFHLAGWAITAITDPAGRPRWCATRGGYYRAAPSAASLRTLMRECPAGEPRGTREGRVVQLGPWGEERRAA